LGDKIEKNYMGGTCSTYGGEESCIQALGGGLDGKRPLGKPTHRREVNIKLDLQEKGRVAWTRLMWLKIRTGGGFCKCGDEHLGSIKYGECLDPLRKC
jgi:hypothetical protein